MDKLSSFGFEIKELSNTFLEEECMSNSLKFANFTIAIVDGTIGLAAIIQLFRIYFHNPLAKWTRQKVFHVMIFAANFGYALYFVINPFAICSEWRCWLHVCGFIFLAAPQIIFLATFLLLLSFWIDLCHQANEREEEEEEESEYENENESFEEEDARGRKESEERNQILGEELNVERLDDESEWDRFMAVKEQEREGKEDDDDDDAKEEDRGGGGGGGRRKRLLGEDAERKLIQIERKGFMDEGFKKKKKKKWRLLSCNDLKVRGRQKIVIMFVALVCIVTAVSATLIGIGLQNASIDSRQMAQIHADFFACVTLISGGGLAFYGLLLYSKMSRLRSGIHSSDLGKVAWLAVICLICFSIRAFLVLVENLSVWTGLSLKNSDGTLLPLWYLVYYLVGQSVPSIVVLITLKDMPPKSRESSLSGSTQFYTMVVDDYDDSLQRRLEEYSLHANNSTI